MPEPGIRELLGAGLHFGHQTRRWNPRMRRYIYGERDGIHVIDLLQTDQLLAEARRFAVEVAGKGGTVLFVGTKKQARDSIRSWAERCDMPYVNLRWLGGLLTNFQTMSARIDRLHELTALKEEGRLDLLPTKERMSMEAELEKRDMTGGPPGVLIIALKTEAIAGREAARLQIPILGLVDTNVDPVPVAFPIPGNDDSMRSCELVISTIGEGIEQAATAYRQAEAKRRAEEEERRRHEEEEKRRRDEEERARREAAEAEAQAAEQAQWTHSHLPHAHGPGASGEGAQPPARPSGQEGAGGGGS